MSRGWQLPSRGEVIQPASARCVGSLLGPACEHCPDCAQHMLSVKSEECLQGHMPGGSQAWPTRQLTARGTEPSSQQMYVTETQAEAG